MLGPSKVTGLSETPSRKLVFSCHPATASEAAAVRRADHHAARDAGVPPPAHRARPRRADVVLHRPAPQRADSKPGVRARAAGDAREPVLRVPVRERRRRTSRPGTITGSATSSWRRASRSSSGAAFRTTSCIGAGGAAPAVGPEDARRAGPAHARRPALRGADDALRRRSGCACRISTRCGRTRSGSPTTTSSWPTR